MRNPKNAARKISRNNQSGPARRAIRAAVMIAISATSLACQENLVDDTYASLGRESINGIDAFVKMVDEEVRVKREGQLLRAGFLSKQIRSEADLVVFFERGSIDDPDYYRHLEAYLFGYDPEELEEPEVGEDGQPQPDEKNEIPLDESVEPVEIRSRPTPRKTEDAVIAGVRSGRRVFAQLEQAPEDEVFEEETSEDEASEDAPDRYKTILYFLRDTDASIAFWQQLAEQMRDHQAQKDYCEQMAAQEMLRRSLISPGHRAPLSERRTAYSTGELVDRLRWDRSVFKAAEFPARGMRFPVRTVPGPAHSYYGLHEEQPFDVRSLLATEDGDDLIRELDLPFARLIVIYNSESFLNHSLVNSKNRLLARTLLNHALAMHLYDTSVKPVAAIVHNRLLKTETAVENEFNIFKFLTVFPLNVIVWQFLALLALFLLSRWPHARPPLEVQAAGNREFLEHIRALGVRLSRTTPRMKALEPLLRYKQKTTGRDYSAVIEKLDEASGGSKKRDGG